MKNSAITQSVHILMFSALLLPACGENKTDGTTSENAPSDTSSSVEIPDDAGPETQPDITAPVPTNIEEYFYAMPAQYVMADKIDGELSQAEKKSMIVLKDLENGFLKVEGKDGYEWPGHTEVVQWKKPNNGGDLIGVNVMWQYPEEAPRHMVTFYEYNAGEWKDVTSSVYTPMTDKKITEIYQKKIGEDYENPMTGETHIEIAFPLMGTTIEVYMEDNASGDMHQVAVYKFKNGKFVFEEVGAEDWHE